MSGNRKNWEWNCNECGGGFHTAEITTTPNCPDCHSSNVVRLVVVSDEGVCHEFLDLKCKENSYPSNKKLRRHVQSGIRKGADGQLVNKQRLIDVDSDQYEERVIDLKTGRLLQSCKKPLSSHRGHGSAKEKERK